MTSLSIMRDAWDPLGHNLNQKELKLGKKWLSYAQFTNGRLRDSSEYSVGCIGSNGASFEQKRSKFGPEMAKLWLIYAWEVA